MSLIETFEKFLNDENAFDMFIIGAAGTGKTTSLHELVSYCIKDKVPAISLAYTHKACSILRSKLPELADIRTLHKFLRKRPGINTNATHIKQIATLKAAIKRYNDLTAQEAIAFANWSTEMSAFPPQVDIRSIMTKITETEKTIHSLENELTVIRKADNEIEAINTIEAEIPGLSKQIDEKDHAIKDMEEKCKNIDTSAQIELQRIENDLTGYRETLRSSNATVASCSAKLALIIENEKELTVIEERLANIKDIEIASLQDKARKVGLVKDAFGEKGLKTLVLDILIPRLEEKINEFLSQMSDFRIRLDTQRASADGESTVEGLYIFVSNEVGEEMDLANYSGGEKLRISIAVTEGVASLSKSVGFRLMDEAIFGLSPEMVQDFSLVLGKLQMKYPQILAISHVPEVKDNFEKVITIKKSNGISYVSP